MSSVHLRHMRFWTTNLVPHLTTSINLNTTTDVNHTFSAGPFDHGQFVVRVVHNASADPAVYLDASTDGGTTYVQFATLHPDLTTTANNRITTINSMPDLCRIRLLHASTSTHVALGVTATLRM